MHPLSAQRKRGVAVAHPPVCNERQRQQRRRPQQLKQQQWQRSLPRHLARSQQARHCELHGFRNPMNGGVPPKFVWSLQPVRQLQRQHLRRRRPQRRKPQLPKPCLHARRRLQPWEPPDLMLKCNAERTLIFRAQLVLVAGC